MFLLAGFSAFLAIGVVGFFFLLISLVLGELFDLGDLLGDHDIDMSHEGGPSFFSSRVVSVFVTAFGGFAAIGVHLGYGIGVSTGIGLGSGLVFGGIVYLFVRFLHGQEASSDVRVSDLVGCLGQVSLAIPRGGVGQVRRTLGESVVERIARSRDGEPITVNTVVKVEAIVGETVLVRRSE